MKRNLAATGAYLPELSIGYKLEFHNGVVGGAMRFCGFEQAYLGGSALVLHQGINIPRWRRSLP
jgi:hypothetical protein